MAEAGKDNDQSMEDILQSIKRIIAEEGDPAPAANGSDVLELTEMLAEGEAMAVAPAAEAPATMSIDDIMAMPAHTPEPEPVVAAPEPQPVAVAEMATSDSLISDITRDASAAALGALRTLPDAHTPPVTERGMGLRSGATVEDLVIEALRPMLKEWLDTNLTALVERLVEREIRKLSGGR